MQNIYKTSDLYFAAYIISCGKAFKGTEKKEEKNKVKTIFVFTIDDKELNELNSAFFSGTATTNVVQFIYALKNLKSLCFVE